MKVSPVKGLGSCPADEDTLAVAHGIRCVVRHRGNGVEALCSMGFEPSRMDRNRIVVDAYVRAIDDETIEVIGWRLGVV